MPGRGRVRRGKGGVRAPRRAVADPAALLHRALRLHRRGADGEAIGLCEAVLDAHPGHFDALQMLGALELARGRAGRAVELLERALEHGPALPAVLANLGSAYRDRGRLEAAERALLRAVEADPGFAPAQLNLGRLYLDSARPGLALAALTRAAALRPRHLETRLALGAALAASARFEEARAHFEAALEQAPGSPDAYLEYATALRAARDTRGAVELLERAVAACPESAECWARLAQYREVAHDLDGARVAAEQALALEPGSALARLVLARLARRSGHSEQVLELLEPVIEGGERSARVAACLSELGQAHDLRGDCAAAFRAFERANAMIRELPEAQIDPAPLGARIAACRAWFTPARIAVWEGSERPGDGLRDPAFLVGFPRSGTTLTEELLARHPAIVPSDEIDVLDRMVDALPALLGRPFAYPEDLDGLDTADIARLRRHYLEGMERALGAAIGARLLLDKLPLNLVHLGMIRRLFPEARVIVALRDPRDVVLSAFMQVFAPNRAMVRLLDLEEGARFCREVLELWLLYRRCLAGGWCESRYERLVEQPEEASARLLEFLGLDPGERAAGGGGDPRRALSTPSYLEVAGPVHGRARGRWRRYRRFLAPALDVLEPLLGELGYGEG